MGTIRNKKLFIDDLRPVPKGYVVARTYKEAIAIICKGDVSHISFDHDLGGKKTGYDIAKFIEEQAIKGNVLFDTWQIHSANPVGKKNIEMAMLSAQRNKKGE